MSVAGAKEMFCCHQDFLGALLEVSLGREPRTLQSAGTTAQGWCCPRSLSCCSSLCRSRAVFVELMQYNPSVDLHAAITLQLEFLGAGQAVTALSISPFPLLRLSRGVTLQLLMMVSVVLHPVPLSSSVTAQRCSGVCPQEKQHWSPQTKAPPAGLGPGGSRAPFPGRCHPAARALDGLWGALLLGQEGAGQRE